MYEEEEVEEDASPPEKNARRRRAGGKSADYVYGAPCFHGRMAAQTTPGSRAHSVIKKSCDQNQIKFAKNRS